MLTKDPAILNLAKNNFAIVALANDAAYHKDVSEGKRPALYNYRKATWENVSKGTRKRYVREATAQMAAIREESAKNLATINQIFTPVVPTEEQIKNEVQAVYEAVTADVPRVAIPEYEVAPEVVEERTTLPGFAPMPIALVGAVTTAAAVVSPTENG